MQAKFEFVTVTPEGLRYRSTLFPSLSPLVKWFKEHFRDPIPGSKLVVQPLPDWTSHAVLVQSRGSYVTFPAMSVGYLWFSGN